MTMTIIPRTVPASEFKAKCLSLLDEVAATGVILVVTKRGRPVARVEPIEEMEPPGLEGSVKGERDLISPIEVPWDASR